MVRKNYQTTTATRIEVEEAIVHRKEKGLLLFFSFLSRRVFRASEETVSFPLSDSEEDFVGGGGGKELKVKVRRSVIVCVMQQHFGSWIFSVAAEREEGPITREAN